MSKRQIINFYRERIRNGEIDVRNLINFEFKENKSKEFNFKQKSKEKHRKHKWIVTDAGDVLCVDLYNGNFIINGGEKFDAVHNKLTKISHSGIINLRKRNEFVYDEDLEKVQLGNDYCLILNDEGIFTFKFAPTSASGIVKSFKKLAHEPLKNFKDTELIRIAPT